MGSSNIRSSKILFLFIRATLAHFIDPGPLHRFEDFFVAFLMRERFFIPVVTEPGEAQMMLGRLRQAGAEDRPPQPDP